MTDFLLELRSEEIPARMQAGARAELEKLFRRELTSAGIVLRQAQDERGDVTVWSTPRRLALIARGLPDVTEAVREEAKGPPEGAPEAALEGFCRKNGVTKDQLQLRDAKGRQTWFAVIDKPGRATKAVLADAIPAIVRDFAWPKSMRWGAASISTESPRWIRPLSGIVAILGEELVECEAAGVATGYATLGHRFHCPGPITIGGAHDYAEKLHACHVIVDHEERAALIREGAAQVAGAGLALVADEGLVVENAGLTEWPVPLLGRFDEAFLDVPPEVIQLTARVNQKYFVLQEPPPLGEVAAPFDAASGAAQDKPGADGGGAAPRSPSDPPAGADGPPPPEGANLKLANAFVCTANIAAEDGGAAIVEGNRKVLAARLSDARFFWEQDRKTSLADHAKKLERITFHEKLGTVADKVERVAKLARWLVEEGIVTSSPSTRDGEGDRSPQASGGGAPPSAADAAATSPSRVDGEDRARLAELAEQAARLCKADLVTEMVGEFPELQGVIGGYYARAEGLDPQIADAIRDHYKPVGQGDEVPTAPVTVAVSLADKLDTIAAFFTIDEKPTGSKDPFALRRAAIGVLSLLATNAIRIRISDFMVALATSAAEALRLRFEQGLEANDVYVDLGACCPDLFTYRLNLIDGEWDTKPRDIAVAILITLRSMYLNFDGVHHASLVADAMSDFLADRLKVQQREAGVRHDLIDAVFALGGEDDLVRLLARVAALQHYIETAEGTDLLAAYKRAANILKKEGWPTQAPPLEGRGRSAAGAGGVGDVAATPDDSPHPNPSPKGEGLGSPLDTQGIARTGEEDPLAMVDDPDMAAVVAARLGHAPASLLSYMPEPAETALIAALDAAESTASAAVAAEDFAAAMFALASLRSPIDRFFDEVTVNDPDQAKRAARLDLLARFRAAVHRVADFSRIEG